ncbi:MAG: tetratricopeptide repeat protein [Aggregatilineales bacterium]
MNRKLLILLTVVLLALPMLAVPVFAQDDEEEELPDCPAFEDSSNDVRVAYYMGEGEGFIRSGQTQAAINSYTCIIRVIDDDYLPAYVERAVLYSQRREYERSIEDYDAIIARDSSSVPAFNNRGIVQFLMQEYEAALEDFDRAIQLESDSVIALNNRSVLHTMMGDYEAALTDLDSAADSSGIGDILALIEDPERDTSEELPEFNREDAITYALRGIVRSRQALDEYNDYFTVLRGGGDGRIQSAAGALESRFTFELRLDDGSWLMSISFSEE